MKKLTLWIVFLLLSGCAVVYHHFNDRLSYQSLKQIKSEISLNNRPSLNIIWIPNDFISRIDVQSPSGFAGSGTKTRIPTGVGLSSRIEEAIGTYADINSNGDDLIIKVIEAKTKFTYGLTLTNLDSADVYLSLVFIFKGNEWSQEYTTKQSDDGVRDAGVTAVVEYAWDMIALDVARSLADKL